MDTEQDRREQGPEDEEQRESGMPGDGKGRTETPGPSGVYPMSGPASPSSEATTHGEASWGQGQRGAAGYEDHGGSELESYGSEKGLGGSTSGASGEPEGEQWTPGERESAEAGEDQSPSVLQGEFPDKRTAEERALTENEPGNVTEGELPAQRGPEEERGARG